MRIVTRGDFDSLVSSVLLSLNHEIDDVHITNPYLIRTEIEISRNDIIANLPYQDNCAYWFDHHYNESEMAKTIKFNGYFKIAPSCSRVIFEYYHNQNGTDLYEKIVKIADKIDSGKFIVEEITNPYGWFLVERTLHAFDPNGKLGDFKEYFKNLMEWIKTSSLSEILLSDEVQQRIEHVRSEHKLFVSALRECSRVEGNVIVTDSRQLRYFPNGNRYLIYTMYPEQNVSVSIFNKRNSDVSVIFCGHSIFNRTCNTDINSLLRKYNGSGRISAGTCVVNQNEADNILNSIIDELKKNG
jgi:hypothetical protein